MKPPDQPRPQSRRFQTPAVRLLVAAPIALACLAGGVYLWARFSTGTSLIARGIMWGDSDAGDLYRFPTRTMAASSDPVFFDADPLAMIPSLPVSDEGLEAVDIPLETFLETTNTTAFIVLHDDRVLYEGYFNGSSHEAIQGSFSAAKSFTSTLIGLALTEGFIDSLDDPITEYVPELLERDPRFSRISLRHLLNMRSGLAWERSDSNPFSDDFITYYSPDLRAAALDSQITGPPGERFQYNDFNPPLLGMVLERSTGMSVAQYMETRLWQPMGAEADGSWSLDSERAGFERMFVGVNGRAIDLIKLGWLFLNDGKYGEVQVVPQSWVEQTTQASQAIYTGRGEHANYYQNYWWLDVENEAYYAEGDKCQFIYVYPKADLVLARFGTDCGGTSFTTWMVILSQWIEANL